jgi:GTPase SAR1 family protein
VIPLRISVHQVKDWVKELHAIVGAGIILVIAGNKADLERSRVVKTETADAYVGGLARFFPSLTRPWPVLTAYRYAKTVGASHFLTSAKANKGIDSVFNDIATSTRSSEFFSFSPRCSGVTPPLLLAVLYRNPCESGPGRCC